MRLPRSVLSALSAAFCFCVLGCSTAQPHVDPIASAPAAAVSGSAIHLRFDWPDGLRGRVRTTSVKSQVLGTQSRTQDMVSTYVMKASRSERGTAIEFVDFQVDRPGVGDDDRMVETVLAYRPGFLVAPEGKLLELIGLETLRDMLVPLQERINSAPEEMQLGLQAVAQTVTSEDYLKARAGADWNHMIGSWVGKTLTPGGIERKTEESPASGILDHPIPTEVNWSISRIDGCHRGQVRECVRLRLTREPQPDALREAMLPNLDQMLGVEDWGPQGAPDLRDVTATSQLIVDAEPDTLVPHRIEALRVLSLEMFRPSGSMQVRDSNRVTSTFQYE